MSVDISVLTEFFQFVDANKDGFISVDEIKEACKVDIDGDSVITEDEMYRCAKDWIENVFPLQDLDGDKLVSLEELLAYASR